jgi:hypothetical protein
MTPLAKAFVKWIPYANGGRRSPPTGPTYSTVAEFEVVPESVTTNTWSIVLDNMDSLGESLSTVADVQLLAPDGPAELLSPGYRFRLLEGREVVALGEIVANS